MLLLLVEDEPAIAIPMISALQKIDARYRITWACTLNQAVALSERRRFDAALVDLTLPDASDCDIAYALRRISPELPVVALTGREFERVAMPLTRAGVQDYLQKGTDSVQRVDRTLKLAIERERQRSLLHRRACYDDLTGVMNRAAFENRMTRAISRTLRSHSMGALVLLDIDEFKEINDRLGHQAGDAVLREVADRLGRVIRVGDTVGRFGGDEFVAIVEGLASIEDAMRVVHKLHSESCCIVEFDGKDIEISTSLGLVVFPTQGSSATELIHLADKAMYAAKQNGKGRWSTADSCPQASSGP